MQQGAMATGAATQADTNNQAGLARIQEQQQAQALLAQQSQGMVQNQLGFEQLGMDSLNTANQLHLDRHLGQQAQDLAEQKFHTERSQGWANVGIGAVGGLLGGLSKISDERAKDNIRPMSASQVVGEIDPIGFEYKTGYGPSGQRLGVGAGQLEQTELGPSLVRTGDDGLKRVDVGGAAMASLAGVSDLSRRLDAMESNAGGGAGGGGMGGGYELSDERTKNMSGGDKLAAGAGVAKEGLDGAQRELDMARSRVAGVKAAGTPRRTGPPPPRGQDPMAPAPITAGLDVSPRMQRLSKLDSMLADYESQFAAQDARQAEDVRARSAMGSASPFAGDPGQLMLRPPPDRGVPSSDPFADDQGVRYSGLGDPSDLPMRDASNGYELSDERSKKGVYDAGYKAGLSFVADKPKESMFDTFDGPSKDEWGKDDGVFLRRSSSERDPDARAHMEHQEAEASMTPEQYKFWSRVQRTGTVDETGRRTWDPVSANEIERQSSKIERRYGRGSATSRAGRADAASQANLRGRREQEEIDGQIVEMTKVQADQDSLEFAAKYRGMSMENLAREQAAFEAANKAFKEEQRVKEYLRDSRAEQAYRDYGRKI